MSKQQYDAFGSAREAAEKAINGINVADPSEAIEFLVKHYENREMPNNLRAVEMLLASYMIGGAGALTELRHLSAEACH